MSIFLMENIQPKQKSFLFWRMLDFLHQPIPFTLFQGKIADLVMMKGKDVLALIKDIAGTRVYDEKRAASEKLLNEDAFNFLLELRLHTIDESLQMLDDRLTELQQQSTELKDYQAADRWRWHIEGAIVELDLETARHRVEDCETHRREMNERAAELNRVVEQTKNELDEGEKDLRKMEQEVLFFLFFHIFFSLIRKTSKPSAQRH
jgi:structural maintenance of chromosome 3 (chondroitin sulfate proteoglycan 6)